jgi:hypothetical protein
MKNFHLKFTITIINPLVLIKLEKGGSWAKHVTHIKFTITITKPLLLDVFERGGSCTMKDLLEVFYPSMRLTVYIVILMYVSDIKFDKLITRLTDPYIN